MSQVSNFKPYQFVHMEAGGYTPLLVYCVSGGAFFQMDFGSQWENDINGKSQISLGYTQSPMQWCKTVIMASLLFVARGDNLFSFHPRQEGIIINYRKLRSIMVLLPIREKHLCKRKLLRQWAAQPAPSRQGRAWDGHWGPSAAGRLRRWARAQAHHADLLGLGCTPPQRLSRNGSQSHVHSYTGWHACPVHRASHNNPVIGHNHRPRFF